MSAHVVDGRNLIHDMEHLYCRHRAPRDTTLASSRPFPAIGGHRARCGPKANSFIISSRTGKPGDRPASYGSEGGEASTELDTHSSAGPESVRLQCFARTSPWPKTCRSRVSARNQASRQRGDNRSRGKLGYYQPPSVVIGSGPVTPVEGRAVFVAFGMSHIPIPGGQVDIG